jgi:hypothetical protein
MMRFILLILTVSFIAHQKTVHAHFMQALKTGTIDFNDATKYTGKIDFSAAEFSYRGITGHYAQYALQGERRLGRHTLLGAVLPIVELESTAGNHTGLSNPVLYGDHNFFEKNELYLSGGLQIGLPSSDDEHGIGSGHPEFLPSLSAAKTKKTGEIEYYGFLQSGFHLSLGGDEHEEHAVPLLINPHEDSEFFFSAGAGLLLDSLHLTPEVSLRGEHAMEGTDAGKTFLSLGLYVPLELNPMKDKDAEMSGQKTWKPGDPPLRFKRRWTWEAAPYVNVPIGRPKRFQWRAGLNAAARF